MENLRGSLLMVFAMVCFATEDMFVKMLTQHLAVAEVLVLLGGLGGGLVFAAAAVWRGDRLISRDLGNRPPVMLRNLMEVVGTIGFVCAIAFTPRSQWPRRSCKPPRWW